MNDDVWDEVPVTSSKTLPPDPRLLETIGLNHRLESALADLVDNSIDASAERVLIRFIQRGARLASLVVVDDGEGMTEEGIDRAMTIGGQRDYARGSLGHFGIGLKAASLGQASALTVASRRDGVAVGRRWLVAKASDGFECDVVDPAFASASLDRQWGFVSPETGTIVRLDHVRDFPSSSAASVTERYLDQTMTAVRRHLGLVFHRLIEAGEVEIGLDVEDVDTGATGPLFIIEPINPFGYMRSGAGAYPRKLPVDLGSKSLSLEFHIWPGRSQLPEFKLPGHTPESHQGFYFYRNNRLLQAGGWNGLTNPDRKLQLARIAVDISDDFSDVFTMNPEKTRVQTTPEFARSVEKASTADGLTFVAYLETAIAAQKEASRRAKTRTPVVPPGKGFASKVRKTIADELPFVRGEDPVDIRWTDFYDESFFDVDREQRVLWLNKRYRWAVIGDRDSSLNDAPLVKALLFLLAENLFHPGHHGPRDKDNIELWNSILSAAAKAELDE